jgi:hypothetical protein
MKTNEDQGNLTRPQSKEAGIDRRVRKLEQTAEQENWN